MKIGWKTFFKAGVTAAVLFFVMYYWKNAAEFIRLFWSAASPLLLGGLIAYVVNILMGFYEKHYFVNYHSPLVEKSRRGVCLLGAMLSLLLIVLFIARLVIPELISCVQILVEKIPSMINEWIDVLEEKEWLTAVSLDQFKISANQFDQNAVMEKLFQILTTGIGSLGVVVSKVTKLFSGVVTAVIGIVFAIYILMGKEKLIRQCNQCMDTYIKTEWNQKIRYVLGVVHGCCRQFIVGQCVEAVILGVLCTAGMLLFRFPYATMIGTLVGATALIPVAGAYIGAGVGTFMILISSPYKAILFLIYIVILQQIEGNLIYPRVVGSSLGLPGIWVLAAITIGGGIGGVGGMLVSVPLTASCYQILKNDVKKRKAMS